MIIFEELNQEFEFCFYNRFTRVDNLFHNKGFISSGFLNLTPHDAFDEVEKGCAIIVDVREERLTGYKCFDVPGVIYMPKSKVFDEYANLPVDVPLIIADSVGLRSHEVLEFLLEKGFTNLSNLAGGIVGWEQDGLPLKIDKSEQLDGSCVCQLRPRNKKNI